MSLFDLMAIAGEMGGIAGHSHQGRTLGINCGSNWFFPDGVIKVKAALGKCDPINVVLRPVHRKLDCFVSGVHEDELDMLGYDR